MSQRQSPAICHIAAAAATRASANEPLTLLLQATAELIPLQFFLCLLKLFGTLRRNFYHFLIVTFATYVGNLDV